MAAYRARSVSVADSISASTLATATAITNPAAFASASISLSLSALLTRSSSKSCLAPSTWKANDMWVKPSPQPQFPSLSPHP